MQQLIVNAPPGNGETLFSGANKINDNFTELYADVGTIETDITAIQADIVTINGEIDDINTALFHAYIRLTGGTAVGAVNTKVVRYANLEENGNVGPAPLPFERIQSANDGDGILINVSGLYTVSMTAAVLAGVNQVAEIRVNPDGIIDNNTSDAFTRAVTPLYPLLVKSTCSPGAIYLAAGTMVWGYIDSAPSAARYENQFTIAGPF